MELFDKQIPWIDAPLAVVYALGLAFVAGVYEPGTVAGYAIDMTFTVTGITMAYITAGAVGSYVVNIYSSNVELLEPLRKGNAKYDSLEWMTLAGLATWGLLIYQPFADAVTNSQTLGLLYVGAGIVAYGYVSYAHKLR